MGGEGAAPSFFWPLHSGGWGDGGKDNSPRRAEFRCGGDCPNMVQSLGALSAQLKRRELRGCRAEERGLNNPVLPATT